MERFFFKKIDVWIVCFLLILVCVGVVLFGAAVRNEVQGHNRFGAMGKAALAIAEIPATARQMLRADADFRAMDTEMTKGRAGWVFNTALAGKFDDYILVSRYDGDAERSILELVDVRAGKVVHAWHPDAEQLLSGASRTSIPAINSNWTRKRFRFIHPVLLEDGSLIVKSHQSPLMRIDDCEQLVWLQGGSIFGHSSELGKNATIWVQGRIMPSSVAGAPTTFQDDSIVQVSLDGNILFQKSIAEIFTENGMAGLIFASGTYDDHRIHLNDVQPVFSDGPYWKKGDLFLSFRNLSMIALYRPSSNRIVWKSRGPWAAQHDVDILDDHRIGVYNNNTFYGLSSPGGNKVQDVNDIIVYDFDSNQFSKPWHAVFEAQKIATHVEGLFTLLPDGHLFVEEEEHGRLLLFSGAQQIVAEFVNRADNGHAYKMGWSRVISRALGDKALAALENATCN